MSCDNALFLGVGVSAVSYDRRGYVGSNHNVVINKQLALSNLFYFNKYVLNYKQMELVPHQSLCDFIQHWGNKQRKLVLLPRGSYKSSMITVGYILWLMVQPENSPYTLPSLKKKGGNKNIRVLIDGEERNKVPREKLAEIKGKILSEKFISLFGKLRPDVGWRDDEITIAIKDKGIWGVPTITIGGVDIELTGLHFDIIVPDDLVGETNVNTDDQLAKVKRHYAHYRSLLDPLGYLIMPGTLWHHKDQYHHILNNPELRAQFDVMVKPAHNEDGSLLFPEVLSEEFLQSAKAEMGSFYYPQYELKVTSAENALVTEGQIKYYELHNDEIWIMGNFGKFEDSGKKLKDLIITTCGDEAYTQEKYSDWTALSTKGQDEDGNWYVLESKRGRWKESDTSFEADITNQTWHPLIFGFESGRFNMLERELNPYGIYPKELKHRGRSKFSRFRALETRFARGKIYLLKSQTNLKYEILCWTREGFRGEHDDESDALSYHLDIQISAHRDRKPLYVGGNGRLGEL